MEVTYDDAAVWVDCYQCKFTQVIVHDHLGDEDKHLHDNSIPCACERSGRST